MPSILILMSGGQTYETIGVGYSVGRRPDPRWQEAIDSVIGDAKRVINIGAGTGSYEPSGRALIAVEPSELMVGQRPRSATPVVIADSGERTDCLGLGGSRHDALVASPLDGLARRNL